MEGNYEISLQLFKPFIPIAMPDSADLPQG